ncbi:MAG: ribosomal protein S18-alanine N-acetyltransferase [Nocardioidaceae bacterium]|nr:MAG: ribosomal protein S18-alanine N-acetyltransferase [Nocardioidaceae bacterium]
MPGDLDWVAKLETETFGPDAWTPAQVAEELLGERRRGFVAVDRSGYAVTLLAGEVADLQRIAVRASLRRTGIGRDLLAHAQQQARGDGAQRMLLEVAASNATALGFYGRAGFAEIDRRPRYYKNGDDAVVMSVGLGLDGSTAS